MHAHGLIVPTEEAKEGWAADARRELRQTVPMVHASSHTDHHGRDRLIRWARVLTSGIGLLGRREKRLRAVLADDLQLQPGDRVLDVGCSPGRLAILAMTVAPPARSMVSMQQPR